MNVLNSLVGLNSVILIFLVVNVFKPFIGSYAAKKGENLATKQDIAQLTRIAEGIRAEISDKVWDRQKQWEMKRDSVIEAIRVRTRYSNALAKLGGLLRVIVDERSDEFDRHKQRVAEAYFHCAECDSEYECANLILDLIFGGDTSNSFRNYHQFADSLVRDSKDNPSIFAKRGIGNELENKFAAFIRSARKALGIKDAEQITSSSSSETH